MLAGLPPFIRTVPTFVIPCLTDEEDEQEVEGGWLRMRGKDDSQATLKRISTNQDRGIWSASPSEGFRKRTHGSSSHFLGAREVLFPKKRCRDCTRMQNEGPLSVTSPAIETRQSALPASRGLILEFLTSKWISSIIKREDQRDIYILQYSRNILTVAIIVLNCTLNYNVILLIYVRFFFIDFILCMK